jgi:hypothetical protein
MPFAEPGGNGLFNSRIRNSPLISLSFFDNNSKQMNINNSQIFINIGPKKSSKNNGNSIKSEFQIINNSNVSNLSSRFYLSGFRVENTTENDASAVHIQIKPENKTLPYFVLVKFGLYSTINSSVQDFDLWKIFCPSGIEFFIFCFIEKFIANAA